MKRIFLVLVVLILAAVIYSGCAAAPAPASDEAQVEAAVEATLTAVAGVKTEDLSTPAPVETESDNDLPTIEEAGQQQAAAADVILPPQVQDFDPVPRPAASRGDPDAPVVMYEWSDYT